MSTSEKFCLKWNDFKENVSSSFGSLRDDTDLTDVTLACEDGQQVEAHKVILSAASPFFQNIFKINKHAHPLVYMRGIKFGDLVAIIDFLYLGEANIYQENLDDFLKIAEELKLKGLTDGTKKEIEDEKVNLLSNEISNQKMIKQLKLHKPKLDQSFNYTNLGTENPLEENPSDMSVALVKERFSGEIQELDDKIKSMWMMIKKDGQRVYVCQMCGKEGRVTTQIRDHIEANHIEGISLPCNFCEKTFRSRAALRMHKSHNHKV